MLAVAVSPDLLAACFARLPLLEQVVTVGCLSHAWKLWAAPRGKAMRRERALAGPRPTGLDVPGWYVMEAWPHLSQARRDRAALTCARSGRLAVLQWVRQERPPCPWDTRVCAWAAYGGHLAVLQWARQQQPPCPWNAWLCAQAASHGHLEVLQWLRQQQPPCSWHAAVCAGAAAGGHLEVLQWARQQQPPCPWDKTVVLLAAHRYPAITAWVEAADD